ncbi:MAG TPA: Ig-like domain repeat protein, partial [Chloroflexota bacterium]|nr:Ig-like domain repeat protein [Chloroflexota bacterium]
CPADQPFSAQGQYASASPTIADIAGNTSAAANSFVVNIDTTAPSISASASTADGQAYASAAWTNQTVTIHFSCADTGGSGIAACPSDQVFAKQGQFTSGAATTNDVAGNTSDPANTFAVNIDLTPPTISATATTADAKAYSSGAWTNQAVTIHFTCADSGGSALAVVCPADQLFSTQAQYTSAAPTVTDVAGNTSARSNTFAVNIDTTAPVSTAKITSGVLNNGWYKAGAPVQLTLTATDPAAADGSESGAVSTSYSVNGGAAQAYSGTPVTFTDGTYKVTFTSTDKAGNVESNPADVVTFKVDQTNPQTSAALAGTQGGAGWYSGAVTLTLTAADPAASDGTNSAVAKTEYSTDGGTTWPAYAAPVAFANDGKYTVSFRSTDNAGNTETPPAPVTFKIDQTAPVTTAAITSGTTGSNGWYKIGQPVIMGLTATDPAAADGSDSAVASTSYVTNGGASQAYSGPVTFPDGTYSVAYSSKDNAGNAEKAEGPLKFNVDQTAPTVTIGGVANGATYTVGGVPAPTYAATDATSGIDTKSATLAKPSTTSGVGTYTYTATATDKAGNTTTVSATYKVVYKSSGSFLPPVSGNTYSANANRDIPLKFDLLDANGNFLSTAVAKLTVNGKDAGTFGVNGNHYQLNIKLRDLGITSGTANVVVTIDDGTTLSLVITVS